MNSKEFGKDFYNILNIPAKITKQI